MSFQVLFHERDVAGFCAECNLRLRTDRTIGRRSPEYYAEFTRQVEASYPDQIQRIFLKTNSMSEAKRSLPGGSSTRIQNETDQSDASRSSSNG